MSFAWGPRGCSALPSFVLPPEPSAGAAGAGVGAARSHLTSTRAGDVLTPGEHMGSLI